MSSLGGRKRVEIPGALYRELEKDAAWMQISVAALATMLLSSGLKQARERSQVPFGGTGPTEPSKPAAAIKES